jgi:hypothetical protein
MAGKKSSILLVLAIFTFLITVPTEAKHGDKAEKKAELVQEAPPSKDNSLLWSQPDDIKTRDLFYGPGGEKDSPHTVYTFEKEDMDGTSPKFTIHDENGAKWKAKLGYEPQPETVASRLVWAVGYRTNEDYYLPEMQVQGMPSHLRRGRKFVDSAGTVHNVRLKRYLDGEEKVGSWAWHDNPFENSRELNGLRVMMALINNWDLKDENNSIYHEKHQKRAGAEYVFMVSDLGASFGSTGRDWTQKLSKGNLQSYSNSKFISKSTSEYVDFRVPTCPSIIHIFDFPEYFRRVDLRWIGKHVPRDDVHWVGQLLAQLSDQQIRDAFRAAGYKPEEIDGFSKVVESRIAELGKI